MGLTNNFDEGLKVIGGSFSGYFKAIFLTAIIFYIAYLIIKYKLDN